MGAALVTTGEEEKPAMLRPDGRKALMQPRNDRKPSLAFIRSMAYLETGVLARMPKVVTANMLATGRVVFLGPNDTWVESVEEAAGFVDDRAAGDALARAQLDQDRALVVEPFLTERGAAVDGGQRPAMTLRDTIRAYGPTIRLK